ncbi:hypothetical protein PF008_g29519 [Phytophthora fragariae]|uniref:RxLR effector protein n=1 Tax=Phytophthora fragariae TaxID=53985 RepID=A0A6G0Q888_9STRA|nr:hypothetical protein PF008_g29519 [Phytophthora fragariae]
MHATTATNLLLGSGSLASLASAPPPSSPPLYYTKHIKQHTLIRAPHARNACNARHEPCCWTAL